MRKVLNVLLFLIVLILVLMSLTAIIAIHSTFFEQSYRFSCTPEAFNTYFVAYIEYGGLFTITISSIIAYNGLNQLREATNANRAKIKEDKFAEWRFVLDTGLVKIQEKDPYMATAFIKLRRSLFDQLYELKFNVDNKEQILKIFNKTFSQQVKSFESKNKDYQAKDVTKGNEPYSYDSFRFLFVMSIDNHYEEMQSDLHEIYKKNAII